MVKVLIVFVIPIFLIPCRIDDVAAGIPAAIDLFEPIFSELVSAGVVAETPLLPDINYPGYARACQ